jgi:hypothetical protein
MYIHMPHSLALPFSSEYSNMFCSPEFEPFLSKSMGLCDELWSDEFSDDSDIFVWYQTI